MHASRRSQLWVIQYSVVAALGAAVAVLFGSAADAEGLLPTPPPAETWTGFSVGVGGGVEFLNADVNTQASRQDEIGECHTAPRPGGVPPNTEEDFINAPCDVLVGPPPMGLSQTVTSNLNDLGENGGFLTVQGAADYQFAPKWVAGAWVDADWSNTDAHARQTQTSSGPTGLFEDVAFIFQFGEQKTTIDTVLSTDSRISVGGRIGWLANQKTLLYFLAGYTHQELDDAQVRVRIADPVLSSANGLLLLDGFNKIPTDLIVKLPKSLDGFALGGGVEVKLGDSGKWRLKADGRWMHFDGGSGRISSKGFESFPVSLEPNDDIETIGHLDFHDIKSKASANLDDVDIGSVRLLLVYSFWTGNGG